MVIGHMLYCLGGGGTEVGVIRLINGLQRADFQHLIISLTDDLTLAGRIKNPAVKTYVLEPQSSIGKISSLFGIVRRHNVDILHARGWPTMFEAALLRLFSPNVRTIFGFHGRTYSDLAQIPLQRRVLQIILARCFDRVVTLCNSMRNELAREFLISPSSIALLPNGVESNQTKIASPAKLRARFGIHDDDFVVGYFGRLDPIKRVDVIIDAFDLFYRTHLKGHLLIAGEGESLHFLQNRATRTRSSNNIIFAGFRDNVLEIMTMLDVYVQASLYEGFSQTLLEAMSCGLPIICTRVGGNPELVEHGVNGYLVSKNDPLSIYDGLNQLFSNPALRHQIKKTNRKTIAERFSLHKMVAAHEAIYTELLTRNPNNRTTAACPDKTFFHL
jgi:glycosyltransferase involved in cell wall biosynthesis